MGYPPPLDAPPPAEAPVDAGFEPSPTGTSICGFGIPLPAFQFSVSIPGFDFMFELPQLSYGLALKCDLSEPLDATFGWGGGRQSTGDPDPDDEYR
jgi:hypothetical protein